jgi:integrase/recombinase XerD
MQLSMQIPTVSIFLDTRFTNADGRHHAKLRVTFCVIVKGKKQWKQKYYLTDCFATVNEFETIMAHPRMDEHKKIRAKLLSMQNKAIELIEEHDIIDRSSFELHFLSTGSVREIDLLFNKKIRELLEQDHISTAEKYSTALRVIRKFGKGTVLFGEINAKWLEKFKKWYTVDRVEVGPDGEKVIITGRSLASFAIHARSLRHIFIMAIAAKIITRDQYPFGPGQFKIPAFRKSIKRYLTIKEKDKFLDYKPKTDFVAVAHDFWTLSYFCNGMNFADIAGLKRRDIFPEYILIDRSKTSNTDSNKKKIIIPIRKEVLAIIARRGNKTLAPGDYVFPILEPGMTASEKFKRIRSWVISINKGLKQIAGDIGVESITTYTARHTFANVILQSGGSTELLQDSLGHSDKRTTERYRDGFELDIKKKYSDLL